MADLFSFKAFSLTLFDGRKLFSYVRDMFARTTPFHRFPEGKVLVVLPSLIAPDESLRTPEYPVVLHPPPHGTPPANWDWQPATPVERGVVEPDPGADHEAPEAVFLPIAGSHAVTGVETVAAAVVACSA